MVCYDVKVYRELEKQFTIIWDNNLRQNNLIQILILL